MVCTRRTVFAISSLVVLFTGVLHGEEGKSPRTDLYDDPLPPGAVMRLGTIRLRHADGRAMAFSKDGKHLISCGAGGEVRVWDVATGKPLRQTRLAGKAREYILYAGIFLAPDGATAAAWDGTTWYVYDTATGRERGRLPSSARMLAFSPDGKKIVLNGADKKGNADTQLWDIVEFKKNLSLDVPPRTVPFAAAFTPDGKQFAALAGDERKDLFVWDTVTGKLKQRKKLREAMASLAYTPDGVTLAAGSFGKSEAALFEAAILKEKAILPPRANVKSTRFASVSLVGFSSDGRLLVGVCAIDGDKSLQENGFLIWELSGTKGPRWLPTSSFIHPSALAPDGKTLACCTNLQWGGSNAIDLWDVASGRRLHQLPGHDTPVEKLAVSPDGKILASSDYKPTIRLWDTATGKPLRSLAGWDEFASACLLFSADGRRLVSVSRKGKLQMWEVATGKELCRFAIDSPGEGVYPGYTVAFLSDGKRLAAVSMMISVHLSIWDAATGKQLLRRPLGAVQPTPSHGHVEFVPDGESITVWQSDRMAAWLGDRLTIEDIATKSLLATLPKDVGHPLAFSADGRLLAVFLLPRKESGGFLSLEVPSAKYDVKGLSLIETASGQEVVRLDIRRFDYVAFTPDGRALIVADKQKLSVWDTATGERLHQMAWPESVRNERVEAKLSSPAPPGQVTRPEKFRNECGVSKLSSLAGLPGGRAATGMIEGDILVWDLASSTWPIRRPTRDQFDALWSDLAGDASTAYRAVSLLAAAPAQSFPLLDARLHPVAVDSKRIDKLLADLDAEQYEIREAASRELARLRYHAEPQLRRTLENKPSLEMRRRLENLLAEPKRPPAEALRMLRAITVLERLGIPEARRMLEKLAGGAATPETRAAQAALHRLKHRDASARGRPTP